MKQSHFILLCILIFETQGCYSQNFKSQGIVPEIVDEEPPSKLGVTYGDFPVDEGHELTPTQVKEEPKVSWDADNDKYYLLLMIDPDAPSRTNQSLGIVKHWLVANIPGNNLKSPEADIITDFLGSGPPNGSGMHRYIFLLYEQKEKLTLEEPKSSSTSLKNRLYFNIRDFTKKYNLGQPIAGNFYMAQWDEYVDELYKKFTD